MTVLKATPSTLKSSLKLNSFGVKTINLPHREKNPGRPGWQNERNNEEDLHRLFGNGALRNVGVLLGEPSNGLVDVDLDCPEAIDLADEFLPPTGWRFGRKSTPGAHSLYSVDSILKAKSFKDPEAQGTERAVLVELRSTGQQTVVPPSVHPSGESLEWERFDEPAHVDGEYLTKQVGKIAAASLLVRRWKEGVRNEATLALAGMLCKAGWDLEEVEKFVEVVVRAASDEELESRLQTVRATAKKVETKEDVTGVTALVEIFGEETAKAVREWLGIKVAKKKKNERNQGDRLIDYVLDMGVELFVDQTGMPHALVDGEALQLNSRAYHWLRNLLWDREGISAQGDALKRATGTLSARAVSYGNTRELHTRSAFHKGAVYYKLGKNRVVKIDRDGWRMVDDPPVLFKSVSNLKDLPDPVRGGTLNDICEFVNLKTDRDRRLFAAYMCTVLLPHVPRPMLQATGVHGSGKTTLGRSVKRTLDPTSPETVRIDSDFLQKASHAHIVMLDNQNSLPEWAVDTLCRIVTGEADSKRALYTDDDDFIYEMKRAVILNGINPPTDRSDAQDRTLPVELERIPDGERKTEEELLERFEAKHPKLLGAIFDALSRSMKAKESLKLSRKPRLADWGEYAAAIYEAEGWARSSS